MYPTWGGINTARRYEVAVMDIKQTYGILIGARQVGYAK